MIQGIPLVLLSFFLHILQAQEIQRFTVQDFDLKGSVKSCLVSTKYGEERFEFNEAGLLTRAVTQYNDSDQDITYYRYKDGELVEKRMESYKDRALDAATSLATFYTIDSIPQRKIVEHTISYDKAFLEQREYQFDTAGQLLKIITANKDGIDETIFTYTTDGDEHTTRIFTHGILEKSITTTKKITPKGTVTRVLTQAYMEGTPNRATEVIYDPTGRITLKEEFFYNEAEAAFVSETKHLYQYDAEGLLQSVSTQTKNAKSIEKYSFQCDAPPEKNWIKQIITPANTYTTRSITYYPEAAPQEVAH